jgi:Ras-related protein Rab-1A
MLTYKIIILGDSACGKTSFMNNYLGYPFNDTDGPTIGVEFGTRILSVKEILGDGMKGAEYEIQTIPTRKSTGNIMDDKLKLTIWNTSGQERFHSIVTSYYRDVKGVIFLCDLTRRDSYNRIKYWIEDFKLHTTYDFDKVAKVIVANKADLVNDRVVSDEDLDQLQEETGVKCHIVSSKMDCAKVREVFDYMVREALGMKIVKAKENTINISDTAQQSSSYTYYRNLWCNIL